MFDADFYKGKKVFVTGHTGFKGTWLCKALVNLGAEVTGYALAPTEPSLYKAAELDDEVRSIIGDIRDMEALSAAFEDTKPEIVFHLAAQPIVRESYASPAYTYETNVMGTLNILECVRRSSCVTSFLNVTTDKVYLDEGTGKAYVESDPLDGYDPYSNSKSCSELITHAYARSFFKDAGVAVSTARAGNVIGGGDFGEDRIIPDCVRAISKGEIITVRNPDSVRPYQYVLEAIYAYLMIAAEQYRDANYADCYNIGPDEEDCVRTSELEDKFVSIWGDDAKWDVAADGGPHESGLLMLDSSKLKKTFTWSMHSCVDDALSNAATLYKCMLSGGDVRACMDEQIAEFRMHITEK